MGTKSMELEEQIRTLEILLANFEIEHVAGDVDDETYNRETELLCTGLDVAKKELEEVHVAMNRISTDEGMTQVMEEPSLPAAEPEPPLISQATELLQNEQPPAQEPVIETIQCKEAQPIETEPAAEEKQQS
jgi:hypothetical protein